MKAYSIDLRTRIVKSVKDGGSMAEASRKFKVCYKSVQRYVSMAEDGGGLEPKPQGGSEKKFGDDALRREVEARPSATLGALGKALGVSDVAILKRLRKLKITLKKNS
jgi:transposase